MIFSLKCTVQKFNLLGLFCDLLGLLEADSKMINSSVFKMYDILKISECVIYTAKPHLPVSNDQCGYRRGYRDIQDKDAIFNVRSKADIRQFTLPHGTNN